MKKFQQNLLVILALSLCVLCVYQWYGQTVQRNQMDGMNRLLSEKLVAIQGYTNSIQTMDGQIAQMDAHINELKATIKTNEELMLAQKREINRLELGNEALTNQITDYKQAVETLEGKLKEAYDGVKKQNDAITQLVAQRDDYVQKLNASIKDRNDIVAKYNELADTVKKLQGTAATEK
jgi:chromosome segregation ATPase